jgi:uracil-DNA glycosylase
MSNDLFEFDEMHDPRGSCLLRCNYLQWKTQADWQPLIHDFWKTQSGIKLTEFLVQRLQQGVVIYPAHPFWALELTALAQVKVVIVGQDPYHGPGQAQGLAFSVNHGVDIPPSLRNIFKELQRDLKIIPPKSGSLEVWAKKGVLLLNTSLTVEQGVAASHAGKGWEELTDAIIAKVAASVPRCVYLLWGAHAQAKEHLIQTISSQAGNEVLILKANHPSPLSASRPPVPFIGCGHFSAAQSWLHAHRIQFDWNLLENL